jgi:hypothetical protein
LSFYFSQLVRFLFFKLSAVGYIICHVSRKFVPSGLVSLSALPPISSRPRVSAASTNANTAITWEWHSGTSIQPTPQLIYALANCHVSHGPLLIREVNVVSLFVQIECEQGPLQIGWPCLFLVFVALTG